MAIENEQSASKWAVCWLDILLLVCIAFGGVALWSGADRLIAWGHRHDKPMKATFEHSFELPMLQAELAMAVEELKTVRARLFEQKIESGRLAADLEALSKNSWSAPATLKDLMREQRIKLDTAKAMIRTLAAEVPEKKHRVAEASAAAYTSQREADIAFSKACEQFELNNRIEVLVLGVLYWLNLFVLAWFGCDLLHRRFGRVQWQFVLIPAFLFLAALSLYHFLK